MLDGSSIVRDVRLGFRDEDREDVRPYCIGDASVIYERSIHDRHVGYVSAVRYGELYASGSSLCHE